MPEPELNDGIPLGIGNDDSKESKCEGTEVGKILLTRKRRIHIGDVLEPIQGPSSGFFESTGSYPHGQHIHT